MKMYKIVLKPKSQFSDIFTADTIFGTVCWYIYYNYGEKVLEEFLNTYNDNPPILLSSMIPNGYIPKPNIPFTIKDNVDDIEKNKLFKKVEWIPIEIFKQYQKKYSQDEFLKDSKYKENLKDWLKMRFSTVDITKNAINRITGQTIEGLLYTSTYYYSDITFIIYVQNMNDKYNDIFITAFKDAAQIGFGNDVSTGKGSFDIEIKNLNDIEKDLFKYKGKYFLTLSECAGESLKPYCYTTFTKYGKLGGIFSQSGINGKKLYNKKPIVFYKKGSTFEGDESINVFGTLLTNVHTDKRIKQYAYAFPVYFDM